MNGAGRGRGAAVVALAGLALAAGRVGAETPASRAELDYVLSCQGCHGVDGRGAPHKVPALKESLPKLMRFADGRDFVLRVPGAANSPLSDAALADVLNWLALRFRDADSPADLPQFSAADVTGARHRPLVGVHRTRRELAAQMTAAGLASPEDY